MVKVERFIQEFSRELEEANAAIFAGAGLSAPAGFVNWKELLRPLADDIGLDVEKEYDLVSLAQYHVNHHGSNRDDLNRAILDNFSRNIAVQTENHRILARLPIFTYWTTNYDTLIEDSLRAAGKHPDVKHTVSQLPQTLKGRGSIVYKMHGDVNHPAQATLCKADYETYHLNNRPFLTALAGDLVSKTFLFIGFSFSDPNLDYVLSRTRIEHGQNQRKHFCILKAESRKKDDQPGEFEYRHAKQQLFIKDLLRYNIRAVLVNDYSEITDILNQLEAIHKKKTVFVSGAAHEYGTRWTDKEALAFVQQLGATLIHADYRLVTGLGLGVGSALVDGALQEIYQRKRTSLLDQLIIRPFPQSAQGKQFWTQYRQDMLSYPGAALFMFGNKFDAESGQLLLSNGMREEFDIACAKGVNVLPLGFTGYMAEELWNEVHANFNTYYPKASAKFIASFRQLGNPSLKPDEYVTAVLDALAEIKVI